MNITLDDLNMMARTLFGEAIGEGPFGMTAVGHVILNRVKSDKWPNTIRQVCRQPKQFSCWNDPGYRHGLVYTLTANDKRYREAMKAALTAIDSYDWTVGATHYFADYIPRPKWAKNMKETLHFKHHIFLRE